MERPQRDDVLLAARRVRRDPDQAGVEHRVVQQPVGALAALVGPEVVALLDAQRIDRAGRDELLDRDRLGRDRVERLELLGRQHDVLALGVLVALDRVIAVDDLVALGADVLLLEPRAVGVVQHVEVDVAGRLVGRVELGRDRDQTERDGGGADRACGHGKSIVPVRSVSERARPPETRHGLSTPTAPSGPAAAPPNRWRAATAPGARSADVRRPPARRDPDALGPPARDRRRAVLVGGAQGAVDGPRGQAARGQGREPPARVRPLRGGDPRRQLRRRADDRVGPRAVPAAGRCRRRA